MIIGLIKEGKLPPDNRVPLTPSQCKWIVKSFPQIQIIVQPSPHRCFINQEYERAGITLSDDLQQCDVLLGIKEVPVEDLIPNKTYLFFSHTRKKQPVNQKLLQCILQKNITLVDYECLEHTDGQRILGFGFFAGVVGAHNGMMVYGERSKTFHLERVYKQRDYKKVIESYFGLKIPNIKIAITGSGRVTHGILEVMNLMGVIEVEKDEYISRNFTYPVYVQLKGSDLYIHKTKKTYSREDFHLHPKEYDCIFYQYIPHSDILMNGIFWDTDVPRLFSLKQVSSPDFKIEVIADVTDDMNGSIPLNLGDQTILNPVYGVDKMTFMKTPPYEKGSVDIIAVGNLPNELPRDASKYFGEQVIKYILPEIMGAPSPTIKNATIVDKGKLTPKFEYLHDYAFK
ncbi:MAG TPA: NAD(P)-dependent oxidoreductase [Flavisolibacter sp.]|nr:NAD(P)-dependent oxidoreductase [Flavisolibacter sp.]